jgi:mannose-1-phosphate guanylyltransferase/mannose-6-phosphate isomerase
VARAGTRVSPESRESLPKQFIPLVGSRSTFQMIVSILAAGDVFAPPVVITNQDYRFRVAERLEEVGVAAELVLEPTRRDSGPAVAVAAELATPRATASAATGLCWMRAIRMCAPTRSLLQLLVSRM